MITDAPREKFSYHAFFCEENVWHLAQDPRLQQESRWVVFLSNQSRTVALWRQRAGSTSDDGLVVWDYHAFVVTGYRGAARAWDLDSYTEWGAELSIYVAQTLRPCAPEFTARALVVGASDYLSTFASDRRHMRGPSGAFRVAPPPWPAPGNGHNLEAFVDMRTAPAGRVCAAPEIEMLLPER